MSWTDSRLPRIVGQRARELVCALCAKWPDGHCTYQTMGFKQEYDGTKYIYQFKYDGVGAQSQIMCEKIK